MSSTPVEPPAPPAPPSAATPSGRTTAPAETTSSAEEAIIAARRTKAKAVRERVGTPFAPFSNDLSGPVDDLGPLRARFDTAKLDNGKYDAEKAAAIGESKPVHVVGRILAFRSYGKDAFAFLRLRDRTGEMQIFCRADGLGPDFVHLDDLDVADFVEVDGPITVTKTGELSVDATRVRLLTKALRPLPDKWKGLADVEMRYRHRYVDLVANPEVARVFQARSLIVRSVRRYLDDAGFLEVETPTLHTLIGGAAATPFTTHHNALDLPLFLRIAPELFLKRLVVGGFERVYEIGRAYRNEGISTRHNPEFTMIEFYEAYATYETIMNRTETMLREVDAQLAKALPTEHAVWSKERPFTLAEPFARVTMKDAVKNALDKAGLGDVDVTTIMFEDGRRRGILARIEELRSQLIGATQNGEKEAVEKKITSLENEASRLREAPIKDWSKATPRAKKQIDWGNYRKGVTKCESAGEALFAAYEYLAEAFLAEDYRSADGSKSLPIFVIDHPFEISPLARRKDADPSLTDRFELFIQGRELANAFSELNDPDDQEARFQAQVDKKSRGAEETMDFDEDYIRALQHGMPPTAGFGMGIDRLVMMLTNQASIRDVIVFPLLRPENDRK